RRAFSNAVLTRQSQNCALVLLLLLTSNPSGWARGHDRSRASVIMIARMQTWASIAVQPPLADHGVGMLLTAIPNQSNRSDGAVPQLPISIHYSLSPGQNSSVKYDLQAPGLLGGPTHPILTLR